MSEQADARERIASNLWHLVEAATHPVSEERRRTRDLARDTADAILAALVTSEPEREPDIPTDESPGDMLARVGADGVKWAAEFRATAQRLGYSDMDEGWLIGWFANAIMAGYDEGQRRAARTPEPTGDRAGGERPDKVVKLIEALCVYVEAKIIYMQEDADSSDAIDMYEARVRLEEVLREVMPNDSTT